MRNIILGFGIIWLSTAAHAAAVEDLPWEPLCNQVAERLSVGRESDRKIEFKQASGDLKSRLNNMGWDTHESGGQFSEVILDGQPIILQRVFSWHNTYYIRPVLIADGMNTQSVIDTQIADDDDSEGDEFVEGRMLLWMDEHLVSIVHGNEYTSVWLERKSGRQHLCSLRFERARRFLIKSQNDTLCAAVRDNLLERYPEQETSTQAGNLEGWGLQEGQNFVSFFRSGGKLFKLGRILYFPTRSYSPNEEWAFELDVDNKIADSQLTRSLLGWKKKSQSSGIYFATKFFEYNGQPVAIQSLAPQLKVSLVKPSGLVQVCGFNEWRQFSVVPRNIIGK